MLNFTVKYQKCLKLLKMNSKWEMNFASAAKEFLEWCGDDYEFITWGSSDLTEFQRNMKHFGVENNFPFPFMYYDLQKLYSKVYSDGKTRRSLKMAIEELGFSEDAEYHSAINDAVYTARIFQQMEFLTA